MRPWLVLRQGGDLRWGGDLRRRYLFDGLVERGASVLEDDRPVPIRLAIRRRSGRLWEIWRRRTRVASTELLSERQLRAIEARGVAAVVDLHDEPSLQADALGLSLDRDTTAEVKQRLRSNLNTFRDIVVPSRPFAELIGLDLDRVIVGSSGTDTSVVHAEPWPDGLAIGFISGAAPRRGIEELVDAARLLRPSYPDLRLLLWLAATSDGSAHYLVGLRESLAPDRWIEIDSVPYAALSAAFGRATVLAIPTPAHAYWDSVVPVKAFDAFAAGRPTVTTPRLETAKVVSEHDVGVVTAGDRPEDIAAGVDRLLSNPELARRQGANARRLAENVFDWRILGPRLADTILARW